MQSLEELYKVGGLSITSLFFTTIEKFRYSNIDLAALKIEMSF